MQNINTQHLMHSGSIACTEVVVAAHSKETLSWRKRTARTTGVDRAVLAKYVTIVLGGGERHDGGFQRCRPRKRSMRWSGADKPLDGLGDQRRDILAVEDLADRPYRLNDGEGPEVGCQHPNGDRPAPTPSRRGPGDR